MGTKIKDLLKGLRYISQVFDPKEEQEMQIGYPTDVKHVAHIGYDGKSMNDNNITGEEAVASTKQPRLPSSETMPDALTPENSSAIPLSSSSNGVTSSRHSRHHHSSKSNDGDGHKAHRDSSESSGKHHRKLRTTNAGEGSGGEEPPVVPKQHRRKPKATTSSDGNAEGSTRSSSRSSSRSKAATLEQKPSNASDKPLSVHST